MSDSFAGLLQNAYWRGVPFLVDAQQVQKGRKLAVHDYPFRDGGWAEDMGRAQRIYRFTGHLLGDFAPVMQLALDAACEKKGPGLLIHPTLGAINVSLLSATNSVNKEEMRVIRIEFQFIEQGGSLFPSIAKWLGDEIGSAVNSIAAFATDLVGPAVLSALATGVGAALEASAVIGYFVGAATAGASDPGSLVAMATALPPPDTDTTYGRYAGGNASTALPVGTTVADLQASLATQRAATAAAGAAVETMMPGLSASTGGDVATAIAAVVEAARGTMTDPADQIRRLSVLATFSFTDNAGGPGLSGDAAIVRDAVAATCRRCVLVSLALAAFAYRALSYNDAVAIRAQVAAAFDVEITAAGDVGDDASYLALKALRARVIADLTTRAASLPLVRTVTLPSSLPSLVVAYRLYQDASRADQIAAETGAPHPAFQPNVMEVLAA